MFIAPMRRAAAMSYEVHEAASLGVPVVGTELLRDQPGWENHRELVAAEASDPEAFVSLVVPVYRSEKSWSTIRNAAAERVRTSCGRDRYERAMADVLASSDS